MKMTKPRNLSWCLSKNDFETNQLSKICLILSICCELRSIFRKLFKEDTLNGFGFESERFYDAHEMIRSIAFGPSGAVLCVGTGRGQMEIFDDLEINREQTLFPKFVGQKYHQHSILDVVYSPDGSTIASCSNDKTIRLINMRDLSCKYRAAYYHNIPIKAHHTLQNEHAIRCIHFPSCLQLLSGESSDCNLKLWDITKHKLVSSWCEHIEGITAIQSHNNMVVTSGIDKVKFFKKTFLVCFTHR